MKYRKLRIAWSVGCGILCLLLIALWVRSYLVFEAIGRGSQASSETTSFIIMSNNGTLIISRRTAPTKELQYVIPDKWSYQTARPEFATDRKFLWIRGNRELIVQIPTWLPVPLLAVVAGMPWVTWRFSIRTLLIGMLVVSAILVAVIYAAN
jgi:hypothetical protein